MKKTFLGLTTAVLVAFAVISPARAQDSRAALLKVPFKFIVGEKLMPAGRYRVSPQTDDWSILVITSVDEPSIAAMATTEAAPNPSPRSVDAHAWFDNYYGQYFLRQVTVPGRDARVMKITRVQAARTLTRLNLMPAERAEPAK